MSARPPQQGKYQGVTRDDVIYLIMPDRFADGDPSNDQPPRLRAGTYDRKSPKAYHGGDLKGVQQHLPYLKDLGVTTLWLTPLYQNDDATLGLSRLRRGRRIRKSKTTSATCRTSRTWWPPRISSA